MSIWTRWNLEMAYYQSFVTETTWVQTRDGTNNMERDILLFPGNDLSFELCDIYRNFAIRQFVVNDFSEIT